jgi:glycosyltransferase involved in cell wall biosynthesis
VSVRLGVDGRELRPGLRTGIRRYVMEVLRAAAARGLPCMVYGDRGSALDDLPAGVTAVTLDGRVTPWWDQVTLPAALRRHGVDVFLSPYYKRPLAAPCPVVVTIHDLFFIGYPGRRRPFYDAAMTRLARLYARRSSAIIADSEHSRRAIVERLGIAAAHVAVIPVGLGPEFRPASPTAAQRERYGLGGAYALYLGNFMPHKNLPRLLRAWAALPSPVRTAHRLVLAGGDRANRPALAALAGELGLGADVGFPGLVDDADLPAVYGGAALYVQPSLEEGFGLPALEAMACGVPVISTDVGGTPEVVLHGVTGFLAPVGDVEQMAAHTLRLLGDEALRATMGAAGRQRAARLFDARDVVGQYERIYERLAGG